MALSGQSRFFKTAVFSRKLPENIVPMKAIGPDPSVWKAVRKICPEREIKVSELQDKQMLIP